MSTKRGHRVAGPRGVRGLEPPAGGTEAVSDLRSAQTKCDPFPDIYQHPDSYPKEDQEEIARQNAIHDRIYRAVGYILIHDFRFNPNLPPGPEQFPGNKVLSQNELSFFLGVYGLLLANNWTDPSLGRMRATAGDLILPNGAIVAKRFVDATVAAVQEYTSGNDLFTQVFGLLGHPSAPASAATNA